MTTSADETNELSPPAGDLYRVDHQPIELAELLATVEDPALGGVAVFLGRVRSPNAGVEVRYLEYEGYQELAVQTLAAIARAQREQYGVGAVAVHHRLGRLYPGEVSMAVVVASAHRAEAFASCRETVDECKRLLPVWKLEVTEQGSGFVAGSATAAPTL